MVAHTRKYKGLTLWKLGCTQAAVAVFDDLIGRFGWIGEPGVRRSVAAAWYGKGAIRVFGRLWSDVGRKGA